MSVAFPLEPVPAYYVQITPAVSHGFFYVGGTAPSFTLSATGPTAYQVKHGFTGAVVSSGSVSGTTVTPTAPSGGWAPGSYRLYLTGGSTDTLFGPAYGSCNFNVTRNDSRFPTMTTVTPTPPGVGGDDVAAQGVLGMGFPRPAISNAASYSTDLTNVQAQVAQMKTYWSVPSGNAYYDAQRPRPLSCPFPNGTWDAITLGTLVIYCKTPSIDGSTVTVTAVAGTSSGTKITVNSETYDNLADASSAVTALAASSLVIGFVSGNGSASIPTAAAATIGNARFNGVKAVVAALYPDVTRFEGPSNEPSMNAETAHQMRLFQAAVHGGNASALAIGPCPVSVDAMEPFFAAGGGAYCDEISFHLYNQQTQGDVNISRTQLDAFKALLAKYSLSSKPLWQTESTNVVTSVQGVYHPRRSRVPLLMTLMLEQYGIPRERNNYWYGVSHGFWSYAAFWEYGDGTFAPFTQLYRTLAEETFGQTHSSILDCGTWGNRVFLGSVYVGSSGSTAVLVSTSAMPNASITLTVTGTTSPLTVVDAWGNSSTVTISGGRAGIPVAEIPTYVRLPAGASVSVYRCNDWPPVSSTGWANGANGYPVTVSGGPTPREYVTDGTWQFSYGASTNGAAHGTTVPDTVTVTWPTGTRVDRVLIFSGLVWQSESTLVDFDVQTSVDGTTWVTQQTVTKTDCTSTQFGASATGTGCQRETFWDEQYVFDVKLPAPVSCKAIRLNVRATSYGGEPDTACMTTGGQGNSNQYITVQEIVTLCDDNVNTPHFGGR